MGRHRGGRLVSGHPKETPDAGWFHHAAVRRDPAGRPRSAFRGNTRRLPPYRGPRAMTEIVIVLRLEASPELLALASGLLRLPAPAPAKAEPRPLAEPAPTWRSGPSEPPAAAPVCAAPGPTPPRHRRRRRPAGRGHPREEGNKGGGACSRGPRP